MIDDLVLQSTQHIFQYERPIYQNSEIKITPEELSARLKDALEVFALQLSKESSRKRDLISRSNNHEAEKTKKKTNQESIYFFSPSKDAPSETNCVFPPCGEAARKGRSSLPSSVNQEVQSQLFPNYQSKKPYIYPYNKMIPQLPSNGLEPQLPSSPKNPFLSHSGNVARFQQQLSNKNNLFMAKVNDMIQQEEDCSQPVSCKCQQFPCSCLQQICRCSDSCCTAPPCLCSCDALKENIEAPYKMQVLSRKVNEEDCVCPGTDGATSKCVCLHQELPSKNARFTQRVLLPNVDSSSFQEDGMSSCENCDVVCKQIDQLHNCFAFCRCNLSQGSLVTLRKRIPQSLKMRHSKIPSRKKKIHKAPRIVRPLVTPKSSLLKTIPPSVPTHITLQTVPPSPLTTTPAIPLTTNVPKQTTTLSPSNNKPTPLPPSTSERKKKHSPSTTMFDKTQKHENPKNNRLRNFVKDITQKLFSSHNVNTEDELEDRLQEILYEVFTRSHRNHVESSSKTVLPIKRHFLTNLTSTSENTIETSSPMKHVFPNGEDRMMKPRLGSKTRGSQMKSRIDGFNNILYNNNKFKSKVESLKMHTSAARSKAKNKKSKAKVKIRNTKGHLILGAFKYHNINKPELNAIEYAITPGFNNQMPDILRYQSAFESRRSTIPKLTTIQKNGFGKKTLYFQTLKKNMIKSKNPGRVGHHTVKTFHAKSAKSLSLNYSKKRTLVSTNLDIMQNQQNQSFRKRKQPRFQ